MPAHLGKVARAEADVGAERRGHIADQLRVRGQCERVVVEEHEMPLHREVEDDREDIGDRDREHDRDAEEIGHQQRAARVDEEHE